MCVCLEIVQPKNSWLIITVDPNCPSKNRASHYSEPYLGVQLGLLGYNDGKYHHE
jgi:hypothetical protein